MSSETEYFKYFGIYGGIGVFSAFLFFPVVRQLPSLRRIFVSLIPSSYVYYWGQSTREELAWLKSNFAHAAWQKFVVKNGQHSKVII